MASTKMKIKKSKSGGYEVMVLAKHPMETGLRKDKKTGKKISRMIINKFTCNYNGQEVFASDWHPAVSANPYLAFYVKAQESGTLEFSWTDDKGQVAKESRELTVTG